MGENYGDCRNFQTWAAVEHLAKTEASWKRWDTAAKAALHEADGDRDKAARILAAEMQLEYQEKKAPKLSGLYSDLMTAALLEIDWPYIAASYLEG